MSVKQKEKTKESLKQYFKDKVFSEKRNCTICDKEFLINHKQRTKKTCSTKCSHILTGRNRGKKSALKRNLRSKDEIYLFEMIQTAFPDAINNTIIADGWDADICIPSKKILIFWNGPWHYKEMHCYNHSLKQTQTRDNIKKQLFESLGWTVFVFEDRVYTPETAFKELVDGSGLKPDNSLVMSKEPRSLRLSVQNRELQE